MSRYTEGQVVVVTANFAVGGELTDPSTIRFKVKRPSGVISTYTYGVGADVTRVSQGVYSLDILCDESGEFWYRAEGTGMVQDAAEDFFVVQNSRF